MDTETWLKIIAALFTVVSVVTYAIADFSKGRREVAQRIEAENNASQSRAQAEEIKVELRNLSNQLQPFKELAAVRHPDVDEETALSRLLADLQGRVKKLSEEVADERNKIRKFGINIRVRYSGAFVRPLAPGTYFPAYNKPYMKLVDESTKYPPIVLKSSISHRSDGVFESMLEVEDGEIPLGEDLRVLSNYQRLIGWIPMTEWETADAKLVLEEVVLTFFVNGEERGSFLYPGDYTINTSDTANFEPLPAREGGEKSLLKQPKFHFKIHIWELVRKPD